MALECVKCYGHVAYSIALKLFIKMMIVLLLGVSNWWSLFPDYN